MNLLSVTVTPPETTFHESNTKPPGAVDGVRVISVPIVADEGLAVPPVTVTVWAAFVHVTVNSLLSSQPMPVMRTLNLYVLVTASLCAEICIPLSYPDLSPEEISVEPSYSWNIVAPSGHGIYTADPTGTSWFAMLTLYTALITTSLSGISNVLPVTVTPPDTTSHLSKTNPLGASDGVRVISVPTVADEGFAVPPVTVTVWAEFVHVTVNSLLFFQPSANDTWK